MVIVSFLTAVLVTLTFVIYPVLGLVVEWYVLFGLLFMSGLIAYGLSWEPRRQSCEQTF
jgi:magnesium-transporting ATPase (P-type)